MYPVALCLFAAFGLFRPGVSQSYHNISSNATAVEDTVRVHWVGRTPTYNSGTTFGLPWPRGRHRPEETTFTISTSADEVMQSQSWVTAYWPDGSIKWTGHAISGSETVYDEYMVTPSTVGPSSGDNSTASTNMTVKDSADAVEVDNGKLVVSFPKTGNILIREIKTSSGNTIGQNGRLLLRSQSAVMGDEDGTDRSSIDYFNFESNIQEVSVTEETAVRTVVTVRGKHQGGATEPWNTDHDPWLPFVLRFYLYMESDAIHIIHTLIYDGNPDKDFVTGIGVRFEVPLGGEELYDRHIRLAGVDGGLLNEAVQGITGLRRDPGKDIRAAQFEGRKTPALETWDTRVSSRLHWIPSWNDYSLNQLSPDGFTLKKRTKLGQSWVNIPGGTRAGGLAYLGGASKGGLAVGLRNFWKRYPTSLDITNAASDKGEITLWLYSPSAQPMDLRPFHGGLGEESYEDQLDALEITYEDWEEGYNTPYGIARTSEIFVFGFESTPPSSKLAALTKHMDEPPVLVPESDYISQTRAIGTYWQPPHNSTGPARTIEEHLDFLCQFYQDQVSQRRWYGFWDHGDIMHTYDTDRHTWRYDIGGYAWDNSELSPDLFFWIQFLRTGREDFYRHAEALTRHTGEVDVYHIGPYKGLGTRHGVQHWGDSSKQIRISTPQYRKVLYYLSGGDERVGELLTETLDGERAFLVVDPRRKVRKDNGTYVPDPEAVLIDTGLDWSGQAASWLIEWERRGPRWEEARSKLYKTMRGIANLKNGFVTGVALYNINNGTISPPPDDPQNLGVVSVTHLTAMFGLVEVIAELTDHLGDDFPADFEETWLDYCRYYGASPDEQIARYGKDFGSLNLHQGHSRLTAYAANKLNNSTLAARAWKEFFTTDGFAPDEPWESEPLDGSQVLTPIDEAAWVSTNDAALYGLAAMQNLALVGDALR
ncbi:hypothetical protein K469DRAFT_706412 [Zopfia rhizophila CBS 207.26]|uniref:Tat pathway signal sequence domain protein n=1 Tax=Zopfia rhizophila CBS 207.26 TaxID=1314779 RepID=A0A6A6E3Q3_9PEZI|nr:hypothetical protein K469DRAFT_706412 [Zopfia rhizophila CBS 207.26]